MKMDMPASSTMDQPMVTTTTSGMSMSTSSSSSSMDMSSSMSMTFTNSPYAIPVLFSAIQPTTSLQVFGIWLAIFFTAIAYRFLVFLRTYLEARHWSSPTDASTRKFLAVENDGKMYRRETMVQPFGLVRDVGRMLMVFVTAMFAYALMLIAMSFVVHWFFAVITGLAVGEFLFARLTAGWTVHVTESCH